MSEIKKIKINYSTSKNLSSLRRSGNLEVKVIRLRTFYNHSPFVGLSSQQTWWAYCLNSFWNNRTFIIFMIAYRSVWPSMKGKVNIINTWCVLVTEAIIVLHRTAIASLISEIWLTADRQRHRQPDLVYVNLCKVTKTLKTKRTKRKRRKRTLRMRQREGQSATSSAEKTRSSNSWMSDSSHPLWHEAL